MRGATSTNKIPGKLAARWLSRLSNFAEGLALRQKKL
jgi:hypothetical protein